MAQAKIDGQFFARVKLILSPNASFYFTAIIYGLGVSLLSVTIPISVQALVNSVTMGVLLQPLFFLSLVLLGLLIFSSFLKAMQILVLELFQRHFYAKYAALFSVQILESHIPDFYNKNGPDLTNRYFDIMTVQKSMTKLFTDGIAIVLQTIVGLFLLALYHPYFLIFDILLVVLLWMGWNFFGTKAIQTAISESKAKYKTASWLRDTAQNAYYFQSHSRREWAIKKSDNLIIDYLKKRKDHFTYLFTQKIFLLSLYAILSALVLGIGGYLVIIGELSLGQLVAAEIVATLILGEISKFGKQLESLYDLFAAVDKISSFFEFKPVKRKRLLTAITPEVRDLQLKSAVLASNEIEYDINYHFLQGKIYYIHSPYNSTKNILLEYLKGNITLKRGSAYLGNYDMEELDPYTIRDQVYVVDNYHIFDGSIKENLCPLVDETNESKIQEVLKAVDLENCIERFPEKLNQPLLQNGSPLWSSQLIRFEIAKSILCNPAIIVLSDIFDQVETKRKHKILSYMQSSGITVINFSKDQIDYPYEDYLILNYNETISCPDMAALLEQVNQK